MASAKKEFFPNLQYHWFSEYSRWYVFRARRASFQNPVETSQVPKERWICDIHLNARE
jgi:hypothetical protein